MLDQKLTLYVGLDFVSVFAMSAFVALTEKGLAFDIQTVDLKSKEQQRPEYHRLSLTARVPTLIHDGFSLSESSAIAEYLDEMFGAPEYPRILPGSVRDRARARQLQAWLRSDLMPIRSERPADMFYFKSAPNPLSKEARAAVDKLFRVATTLLEGGAQNLFGDWCIADTDLTLMLNRLVMNGDDVPEGLARYTRQQWQRPSVQRWVQRDRSGFAPGDKP